MISEQLKQDLKALHVQAKKEGTALVGCLLDYEAKGIDTASHVSIPPGGFPEHGCSEKHVFLDSIRELLVGTGLSGSDTKDIRALQDLKRLVVSWHNSQHTSKLTFDLAGHICWA